MFAIPLLASAGAAMGGTMGVLSTAMSVIGTLASAKSEADAAKYNAKVATQQAGQVASAANQQEEAQRRKARIFQGEQRAAISESGTGLGGSNLDIERQSEVMQELDALNIRYEGNVQRTGLLNQAALYKSQAKGAMTKGLISAAGTLFGSGLFKGAGGAGATAAKTTGGSGFGLYGNVNGGWSKSY